jgi:hypothetical protein
MSHSPHSKVTDTIDPIGLQRNIAHCLDHPSAVLYWKDKQTHRSDLQHTFWALMDSPAITIIKDTLHDVGHEVEIII